MSHDLHHHPIIIAITSHEMMSPTHLSVFTFTLASVDVHKFEIPRPAFLKMARKGRVIVSDASIPSCRAIRNMLEWWGFEVIELPTRDEVTFRNSNFPAGNFFGGKMILAGTDSGRYFSVSSLWVKPCHPSPTLPPTNFSSSIIRTLP